MALTPAQKRLYGRRPRPNTRLQSLRLNAGFTPNELARRAGVSGNTVRSAERGFYIGVHQQHAIAEVLEVELLELFPLDRQRLAA